MCSSDLRVSTVEVPHQDQSEIDIGGYSLFLSHRGRDSKVVLAEAVGGEGRHFNVFLDCLSLPKGIINRNFVFNSLCRSDTVFIVESQHYLESAWCRKEAWLAEEMARLNLLKIERLTLGDAVGKLAAVAPQKTVSGTQNGNLYEIAHRRSEEHTSELQSPDHLRMPSSA